MSKSSLFDCSPKSEGLVQHFRSVFNEITCETPNIKLPIFIGPNIYSKIHVVEDTNLLLLLRSRWFCIQKVVLNHNDATTVTDTLVSSREFINQTFKSIIESLLLCDNPCRKEEVVETTLKLLKIIANSIVPVEKLKSGTLVKIGLSNRSTCPIYQYLHTLLEMHYYMIILYYICCSTLENMEKHLGVVMKNLVLIAKEFFKKTNKCYSCNCVKFFWLVIQLITEKVDISGALFWKIFNRVLENETPLFALTMLKETSFIQCFHKDFEEQGVNCERIKPNFEFLEFKFKELLSQADCDTLIYAFRLIEPLVCSLWIKEGKINTFQIIWDFYSKRLNVSNKNSVNISALHLTETLAKILLCPKNCEEDFEIYIGLLVCYLREYPMQWGKMKGRIYSQLGPNKVKDLSDVGLRHVMLLFLALSVINFEELEKKILAFLENLPINKRFTPLVWNLYGSLVLKYVQEGRSIEKITPPILRILQEASADPKMFNLIKEFIKNLEHIIVYSTNMQLQQWLLFGPWLGKYLSVCYYADLNQTLNVVLLLLEKCSNPDSWSFWETCFKDSVYPNLRHLAGTSNAPAIIGTITGKLALLYTNLTTEIFAFFTSETVSPKISLKFLEAILAHYPDSLILTPQQESIIVQSWIKICFLTTESNCILTRNIIKLDIIPIALKSLLKTATSPVYSFIEYLGNNSKQLNAQSQEVNKICEVAFGNLDKTLTQYLLKPESEAIVLNFYQYVASAFLNCGHLIYNRNKPVTPLTKLVQCLLLPMDFLVGKTTPHNFVLNAVKKTWHTFFEAFMNLNNGKDPYLERTLKDMVVKYMPYFSTLDSPIVTSLENPKFSEIILEKICNSYFKPPVKESDANVLKALKIVSDLANRTTSFTVFRLLIHKTLYGLFEVVIFHSQRSTAIGVIKNISSSPLFGGVKTEFKSVIFSITEKNLGLNSINYFQLMMYLAKFVPSEIKDLLEDIKRHVTNVERLRGVGFDKSLRLHIEKLESALEQNNYNS